MMYFLGFDKHKLKIKVQPEIVKYNYLFLKIFLQEFRLNLRVD